MTGLLFSFVEERETRETSGQRVVEKNDLCGGALSCRARAPKK